jgi:hypothetical protein
MSFPKLCWLLRPEWLTHLSMWYIYFWCFFLGGHLVTYHWNTCVQIFSTTRLVLSTWIHCSCSKNMKVFRTHHKCASMEPWYHPWFLEIVHELTGYDWWPTRVCECCSHCLPFPFILIGVLALWPLRNLWFPLKIWNLEWQFVWFASANHFLIAPNSQICMRSWKCP